MVGVYSEKLRTGGELKVSTTGWSINYYFSGPDRRYNGTFVSISEKVVDQYISAWANNFYKYQELKKSVPAGGSFHANGEMGMSINVGGFSDGVCLRAYHMPIKTEEKLIDIVEDYEYAKKRATQMMEILQKLK